MLDSEITFYQQFFRKVFFKSSLQFEQELYYLDAEISRTSVDLEFFIDFISKSNVTVNFGFTVPLYCALESSFLSEQKIPMAVIGVGYLNQTYDEELWYTNLYIGILDAFSFELKNKLMFSRVISMYINAGTLLYPVEESLMVIDPGFFYGKVYYEVGFSLRILPSYRIIVMYNNSFYGFAELFWAKGGEVKDTLQIGFEFGL